MHFFTDVTVDYFGDTLGECRSLIPRLMPHWQTEDIVGKVRLGLLKDASFLMTKYYTMHSVQVSCVHHVCLVLLGQSKSQLCRKYRP